MATYRIETERLVIRPWQLDDVPAFHAMTQDPVMMRYISDGKPWTEDQVNEFFERQARQLREVGFCLGALERKEDTVVMGIGGLQPMGLSGDVEVGWWIQRDSWGMGYATELGRAAVHHGFVEAGLPRVASIAMPANKASRRVMEKLGMTYQGERTGAELKLRNPRLVLAYYLLSREDYLHSIK